MRLFRRKKKAENITPAERKLHNIFRGGAVIIIGYVLYTIYISDNTARKFPTANGIPEEQVEQRVKEAFEKMTSTPEYKDVKDFVSYINSQEGDKSQPKIINANQGILVYIPQKLLVGGGDIDVSDGANDLKISIKQKEKPE